MKRVSGRVWGNIGFGCVTGLAVDAITGRLYNLPPAALLPGSLTSKPLTNNEPGRAEIQKILFTHPLFGFDVTNLPGYRQPGRNNDRIEIFGLICFDLSIGYVIDLFFKRVGSRHTRQITTVDHADIRGLVTTRLHYVVELAFL